MAGFHGYIIQTVTVSLSFKLNVMIDWLIDWYVTDVTVGHPCVILQYVCAQHAPQNNHTTFVWAKPGENCRLYNTGPGSKVKAGILSAHHDQWRVYAGFLSTQFSWHLYPHKPYLNGWEQTDERGLEFGLLSDVLLTPSLDL